VETAGIGIDLRGTAQAHVVETEQGVSFGIVLAALPGCAPSIVRALLLVSAVHRIHRALIQGGELGQTIRQHRLRLGQQRGHRRRQNVTPWSARERVGPSGTRQWRPAGRARFQMQQGLHLLAQCGGALQMTQHPQADKVEHAQYPCPRGVVTHPFQGAGNRLQ